MKPKEPIRMYTDHGVNREGRDAPARDVMCCEWAKRKIAGAMNIETKAKALLKAIEPSAPGDIIIVGTFLDGEIAFNYCPICGTEYEEKE